MCANYDPAAEIDFDAFTKCPKPNFDFPIETWKDYAAPILRKSADEYLTVPATFGGAPQTHPAGREAFRHHECALGFVGEKRSYSGAWQKLQFCVIPCRSFYEPSYETGSAVRWRIGLEPGKPLEIAGLWRAWAEPEGTAFSFTTLTINSDEHPLMRRFHKRGAEKRSVVILWPEQYDDWLGCSTTDEARAFLNLFPADEMAPTPAPIPPRRREPQAGETGSLL